MFRQMNHDKNEQEKKIIKRSSSSTNSMQHDLFNAEKYRIFSEKQLPAIIDEEINNLLVVNSKQDIANALRTLYGLRDYGIPFIWDAIKENVQCKSRGLFVSLPDELIDLAQTQSLDIAKTGNFVANEIARFDMDKHEEAFAVDIARHVSDHTKDQELQRYLAHDPGLTIEEITMKVYELEKTTSELLKLAEYIISNSIFSNRQTRPVLGCEAPPGSYQDESGRTVLRK